MKFLIKFFPSICVLVVFHFLSLFYKCKEENSFNKIRQDNLSNSTNLNMFSNSTLEIRYKCHLFAFDLFDLKLNSTKTYNYWSNNESVQFSQLFNHFFFSIYFVFISSNYVCIEKSFISYVPFRNTTWTKCVITV